MNIWRCIDYLQLNSCYLQIHGLVVATWRGREHSDGGHSHGRAHLTASERLVHPQTPPIRLPVGGYTIQAPELGVRRVLCSMPLHHRPCCGVSCFCTVALQSIEPHIKPVGKKGLRILWVSAAFPPNRSLAKY